jgi:hypothetical protein
LSVALFVELEFQTYCEEEDPGYSENGQYSKWPQANRDYDTGRTALKGMEYEQNSRKRNRENQEDGG